MLEQNELQFLYRVLDQLNIRGEDNKAMVVIIMRKLRQMMQKPEEPPKD